MTSVLYLSNEGGRGSLSRTLGDLGLLDFWESVSGWRGPVDKYPAERDGDAGDFQIVQINDFTSEEIKVLLLLF